MSAADTSWTGVPLPGNEAVAARARDLVAAAEAVVAKQGKLAEALAKHVGRGQDPEKTVTATVDNTGRAASVVVDERAWHARTRQQVEAAIALAFADAHDNLQAKKRTTEQAFRKALDLGELPTVEELYEKAKLEEGTR